MKVFLLTDWFLISSDNNPAYACENQSSKLPSTVIHSILSAPSDPLCSLVPSQHCSQTTISATKSTSLQIFSLGVRFVFWLLREETGNKLSSEDFYIPLFNRLFLFEHHSVTAYHRESKTPRFFQPSRPDKGAVKPVHVDMGMVLRGNIFVF